MGENKTMKVDCEVSSVDMDGDYATIPGVCVTCTRCQHEVEVYGESGASIRRGLLMLREECPKGESNFYTADGDDD